MTHPTESLALPLLVVSAALAALSGCATSAAPAAQASAGTETRMGQAVTAPLGDLNLVRAEIPAVLSAARKSPYGAPAVPGCAALAAEVQSLDAVLGADLDTPPTAADPGLIERGSAAAGDAAVGAVRGAAEGVVPFRGWVRRLSGADASAREAAAAVAAGSVRRAYLKGLGRAQDCAPPAAPRH